VAAEKVILAADKRKWQSVIKTAYQSQALKDRIKLEKQGIKDLTMGRYKFN